MTIQRSPCPRRADRTRAALLDAVRAIAKLTRRPSARRGHRRGARPGTDAGLQMPARRRQCLRRRDRGVLDAWRWSSRSARASAAADSSCCTTRTPAGTSSSTRAKPRRLRRRRRPTSTRTASSTATAPRTARWSAGIPGPACGAGAPARNYGRLPLKTSLAPAIRIAREGFPVYARLATSYGSRRDT